MLGDFNRLTRSVFIKRDLIIKELTYFKNQNDNALNMIQQPAITIRVNKFQQSNLVSVRLNPLVLVKDQEKLAASVICT
ncbi:MAG TPA: hypothetical protein DEF48_22635 [Nostoc sp. UBA8866]|uniref:Uncharacterized protein n=1 Tax=Trichormus variabilis NIES-23 TaxID=1973479 RepID=A0A1Z4KK78_ANAVA|nr:hypothetical protein NIES23_21730 [Trichormus variabilis NIES-23]HBW32814.1 hypothetical protein [Nostoc sp. UBA8866]